MNAENKNLSFKVKSNWEKQLNVRYLQEKDVLTRRKKLTSFKATELSKFQNLKCKGKYLDSMYFLNKWLNEHLDEIYLMGGFNVKMSPKLMIQYVRSIGTNQAKPSL